MKTIQKLLKVSYIYFKFKVILIGEANVGKSTILARYIKGFFSESQTPTVAVEFCAKIVKLIDGTRIKAQIWDTAGQEKYRSLVSQHYRKALGALLVFDLTKKETFNSIQKLLYDLKQWSEPDCVVYLVGNKVDLINSGEAQRAIQYEYAKNFAEENQMKYIETSAKTDLNISDCFINLLEDVNKVNVSSRVKHADTIGRPIQIREKPKHMLDEKNDDCSC